MVNDTCGHLAGDEMLCRVTALLQDAMRETDMLARLGGDEFGVLLARCTLDRRRAADRRVRRAVQQFRFAWRDKIFAVGVSIGLVPITREFRTVAHVLSAADAACYVAKEKGRNRVQVYQEDDATFVRRHGEMKWVERIQRTLEEDRFCLFSQQIQPLSPSAAAGALLRDLLRMVEDDGRIHLPVGLHPRRRALPPDARASTAG